MLQLTRGCQKLPSIVRSFNTNNLVRENVMSDYLADVQRCDAGADADTVGKIVKYPGIALRGRDAALVAC